MKGVLTLYALVAFYSVACGEVVDLDNSNFDQVMHFLLYGSCAFTIMWPIQYVNGDKDVFVEFYAPCKCLECSA